MSRPQILDYDTRDDRREVYRLLARLHPDARVAFVEGCCRRAALPGSATRPGVARRTRALARQACLDDSADERLTLELFFDLWNLSVSYAFDLDAALARLVAAARQPASVR